MKYQLLIVFLLGLLLAPAGFRASAADISGTWAFSVSLDGGPQNFAMTFVFKQAGEKLTGSQTSGTGEPKVTGTVKGNKVEFSVEGKMRSGETYKNSFTGAIESPDKMTGGCEFPKGSGKWTATKK
ncbi:MAG TPA: hypothetical protein VJ810_17440 [Blastocatellia bacterium]|nr:hypothetical protein [Blastocatellia bacterium]